MVIPESVWHRPLICRLFARHPAPASGLENSIRHRCFNTGVEGRRNNILFIELVFGDQIRQRLSRSDLHLIVDIACTRVQSPAEDSREYQDIVDLVGIIAAPGGDNSGLRRPSPPREGSRAWDWRRRR